MGAGRAALELQVNPKALEEAATLGICEAQRGMFGREIVCVERGAVSKDWSMGV